MCFQSYPRCRKFQALNSLGATPRDMMTIFHMLKAAEALQAELIIK